MADVDLQGVAARNRSFALTDLITAANPTESDAAEAFKTDTLAEFIAFIFANPPPGGAAVTIAQVLATILEGQGMSLDRSVNDQLTLNADVTQGEFDTLAARVAALEMGQITPTPGMHVRYFGWSTDRVIATADFAAAANAMSDNGNLPARTQAEGNAYVWVGVPEAVGEPSGVYEGLNPINQIAAYTRQAGTVDDSNGDPHILLVSNDLRTYHIGGEAIRIEHP